MGVDVWTAPADGSGRPSALPGQRRIALDPALNMAFANVHARATRPTGRWLTRMVAKGVILASATDTACRTSFDPRAGGVARTRWPTSRSCSTRWRRCARRASPTSRSSSCPATEADIREAVGDGAAWGLALTHLLADGGGPAAPLHAAQAFVEDGPFILQRGDGLLGDSLSSFAEAARRGAPGRGPSRPSPARAPQARRARGPAPAARRRRARRPGHDGRGRRLPLRCRGTARRAPRAGQRPRRHGARGHRRARPAGRRPRPRAPGARLAALHRRRRRICSR